MKGNSQRLDGFESDEGFYKHSLTLFHHKKKNLASSTRRLNNSSLCVHAVPACRLSPIYVSLTCENKFICYEIRNSTKHPLTTLAISGGVPVHHKINPFVGLNQQLEVSRLEFVVGFESGSILFYDVIKKSNKIMNKRGRLEGSSTNSLEWINSDVFVTCHENGRICMFNKNFPDGVNEIKLLEKKLLEVKKKVRPTDNDEGLCIVENESKTLTNPLAIIDVCNSSINDIALNPNKDHFAVACDDGYVRVVRYCAEDESDNKVVVNEKDNHAFGKGNKSEKWQFAKLVMKFQSFFSGVNCCAWSGDGKYIVAGGDDDLISVFSFVEKKLVARGVGHKSFIRRVQFDNDVHKNEDNKYRIISAGDDCCILLWDLIIDNVEINLTKRDSDSEDEEEGEKEAKEKAKKEEIEKKKKKSNVIITIKSKSLEEEPYFEPSVMYDRIGTPVRGLALSDDAIVTLGNKYLVKFFSRPGKEKWVDGINISKDEDSSSEEEEEEKRKEEPPKKNDPNKGWPKSAVQEQPKKSFFQRLKSWVSFV